MSPTDLRALLLMGPRSTSLTASRALRKRTLARSVSVGEEKSENVVTDCHLSCQFFHNEKEIAQGEAALRGEGPVVNTHGHHH